MEEKKQYSCKNNKKLYFFAPSFNKFDSELTMSTAIVL